MTDPHEALLAALRIARDHEVGLEMIERACDPTVEDYSELNETKPQKRGEDQ